MLILAITVTLLCAPYAYFVFFDKHLDEPGCWHHGWVFVVGGWRQPAQIAARVACRLDSLSRVRPHGRAVYRHRCSADWHRALVAATRGVSHVDVRAGGAVVVCGNALGYVGGWTIDHMQLNDDHMSANKCDI